jgi:hypothetical protein
MKLNLHSALCESAAASIAMSASKKTFHIETWDA